MPTLRLPDRPPWESSDEGDRAAEETSEEPFDRAEFARRALALVGTPNTTVAICEGSRRMRVESGRVWGRRCSGGAEKRWALLAISPMASRRAIALAVAELAHVPGAYALDVLFFEAQGT